MNAEIKQWKDEVRWLKRRIRSEESKLKGAIRRRDDAGENHHANVMADLLAELQHVNRMLEVA